VGIDIGSFIFAAAMQFYAGAGGGAEALEETFGTLPGTAL